MNSTEFERMVKTTMKRCLEVLKDKAQQYAPVDRHANFKMCAKMRGKEPEQALIDMWMKHLTWIIARVDELPNECERIMQWDERIIDTINYMLLLRGLIVERLQIPEAQVLITIDLNCEKTKFIRPEVLDFAVEMEKKMAVNDHKSGWCHYTQSYLAGKLVEEVSELLLAIEDGQSHEAIIQEAADVGNFAMMIADVVNRKKNQGIKPMQLPPGAWKIIQKQHLNGAGIEDIIIDDLSGDQ